MNGTELNDAKHAEIKRYSIRVKRYFKYDMRVRYQTVFSIALYLAILLLNKNSFAQAKPVATSSPILSTRERQELEQFRQEKRIRELVDRNLQDNAIVRAQVESEVDRAFNKNTTLLNILLGLLTLLPVLVAVGFLLLRRSVINEIVTETKKQLQQEVHRQLEEEVAAELKEQTQNFREQIEALKLQFVEQLSQLQNLFVDAQEEKKKIFEEISKITSPSIQKDTLAPASQRKIQELTNQLESLKETNFRLLFTVDDYVREGDAFYYENRYQDAIAAYDEAIKVEPTVFAAWRGKSRTLRRLKQYEEAMECNIRAMQIKPDDSLNWFERGCILQGLNQFTEALVAFNRSIDLKPTYYRAWNHRGYIQLKLGQYEEALVNLEKGRTLKPDYGNPYYAKAYYYVLTNQIEPAIEQLRQAIIFYPRYRDLLETDPDFDSIRADDRFKKLLEEQFSH